MGSGIYSYYIVTLLNRVDYVTLFVVLHVCLFFSR